VFGGGEVGCNRAESSIWVEEPLWCYFGVVLPLGCGGSRCIMHMRLSEQGLLQ
jgi:hypothetical protein